MFEQGGRLILNLDFCMLPTKGIRPFGFAKKCVCVCMSGTHTSPPRVHICMFIRYRNIDADSDPTLSPPHVFSAQAGQKVRVRRESEIALALCADGRRVCLIYRRPSSLIIHHASCMICMFLFEQKQNRGPPPRCGTPITLPDGPPNRSPAAYSGSGPGAASARGSTYSGPVPTDRMSVRSFHLPSPSQSYFQRP